MPIIRKFLRMVLKKTLRSNSLKDSRNIIHQLILFLTHFKNKKLLLRNKFIKDSFVGKRCFVLFTGGSVIDFDFDLLKNEPVIACGASVLHKDFKKCNVVAYFNPASWEPRSLLFFDFIFSSVFKLTKKGCSIILHTTAFPYTKELSHYREQDTFYMASDGNYLSTSDINSDLQQLNNIQEGSISTALGIASYMGFQEIYLLGADYLSDPPVYGHFYDGFNEVGNPSDYKLYRERASLMIDHVTSKRLFTNKKPCRVINVVKNNQQVSSEVSPIESITFQDLKNMENI